MRVPGRRTLTALALLALVLAAAAYPASRYLRGRHHARAAQEALERRDFRQARLHLEKCLEIWPNDLEGRLQAARTARRLGDYQGARQHLRVYREKNGDAGPLALEVRLLSVQEEGNLQEADNLLAACASNPEAEETPLMLEAVIEGKLQVLGRAFDAGMVLVHGPPARELAGLRQAVGSWLERRSSEFDRAQALVWRGRIHVLNNERSEGEAAFRAALERDAGNFDARMNLAAVLGPDDPKESAEHLEVLSRQDPRDNQVRLALAVFQRSLRQFAKARQTLDGVLAADPGNLLALIERGKVALDDGRPAEAEPDLRTALALAEDPRLASKEPEILLPLSRCLFLTGKEEEAKHFQERYRQLESERARAIESERARLRRELSQQGKSSPEQ